MSGHGNVYQGTGMTIPKIYILCGNATYNRGDRGNLTAQLDLLLERFPGADITIDSFRKDIDEHWYPVRVIERGAFLSFKQLAYLARADVVVWGGWRAIG